MPLVPIQHAEMPGGDIPGRGERWWNRREERRGLRPRDAAYLIVAFWLLAVVVFGVIEHLADSSTFPTVWLGMWWALQTVTTVGYGDVVPQDTEGRVAASFLLLGGLALLSVVTATITSAFVERRQRERRHADIAPIVRELEQMSAQMREVHAQLERLRQASGGTDPR
jgi:voltage-gated potassium channel